MEKGERLEARIEAQLRQWAAELEGLKAKADTARAGAQKEYYEQVDALRKEIEEAVRKWSTTANASDAQAGSTPRTLVERLHARIQAELRELRPHIVDLRGRAARAEQEARRLARELQAKREPARAALGELRAGAEKAWGELRAALDSAITKFREPS
jgi:predicted  nucleic acid-binding Zn-ribbon protein